MTQLDDLTAAVATLKADFATFAGDVATKVTALQSQITALQNSTGVDLSGVLATIADLDTTVKAADASLNPPAPAPDAPAV